MRGAPMVGSERSFDGSAREVPNPDYPDHLSNLPCPLPRWIGTGAYVGYFPVPRGLPRQKGGSASTISLSRPAQTSLALRPAGSLDRPRRPLSRGFETASYPTAPLVSYQINRQLSGWVLPPLVFRTFRRLAHEAEKDGGVCSMPFAGNGQRPERFDLDTPCRFKKTFGFQFNQKRAGRFHWRHGMGTGWANPNLENVENSNHGAQTTRAAPNHRA